jgi:DNA-binding MarR family transcriptional regulator
VPAPTKDETTLELASRVRQVVVPLARHIQRTTSDDFTPTELSIVGAVLRHGPIMIGELATRERLSTPTTSKVVAALERARMIERVPDPDDRRVCRVQISRTGKNWVERTRAARNVWLAERITRLPLDERAALEAAVAVLQRFIDDQ